MCGIAGIQLSGRFESETAVSRMVQMIHHRGPDDNGEWRDGCWNIGMARLAIMDPGHARQPLLSSCGRWVVVFNGELYNFRSVRDRLVGKGIVFKTKSDTEVLAELVASVGVVAALSEIEGMFAFAAVDRIEKQLWLARDRFGEKPLFIDRRRGRFAFCSELSPLLQTSPVENLPSAHGVAAILRHGHHWPGSTAVAGVSELLPSQWLCRSHSGEERTGIYWHPPDRVDEQAGTVDKCGQILVDLLQQSVDTRLVADVPLGLFLSGGIDSAAVAALARNARPDICAVTMGFDTQGYDETPQARQTAKHLGIQLIEERGSCGTFSVDSFDELLYHHGQPFSDTSSIPTRMVSRAARGHFKVVLSGDGGDELLSGYLQHIRNAQLTRWGGGRLGGTLSRAASRLFASTSSWEGVQRALRLNGSVSQGLLLHEMDGVFTDEMLFYLFHGSAWEKDVQQQIVVARDEARRLWRTTKDSNLAFSLHQLRMTLPQTILAKVDRMSMAESLEVRSPMLDSRFASYALSLPARIKVHRGMGKYVLRHALRKMLPEEILQGPKRGFSLPLRNWLGERFWIELRNEVKHYHRDGGGEFNLHALHRQIDMDENLSRRFNSYRALHRMILVYSFLRWRRRLNAPEGSPEHVVLDRSQWG